MHNSVRFFPHWNPADTKQVIGFLRCVNEVRRVLGDSLHWVEVGGYLGESATLVLGFPFVQLDIVEASDWHADQLRRRFATSSSCNVIHAKSADAASTCENESVDVVYIDANHSYESVRDDIDAWLPKIRRPGFLAGHDYHDGFPGVQRAVDERFKLWATFSDSSWLVLLQ